MTASHPDSVPVPFDRLQAFMAAAFERLSFAPDDARAIATLMAEAELQGSDGHGAIRLAPYIKRIRAGGVNVRPNIRVIQQRAATALIFPSATRFAAISMQWPTISALRVSSLKMESECR